MDFNNLYKKIADIDTKQVNESSIEECGAMPPSMPSTPPKTPMSMTVNLNAQGEEDISSLMRLLTKVNPDMMPKTDALPTVKPELSITGPGPIVGSPDANPAGDMKSTMMKLLPLDHDKDHDMVKKLDRDGDGDHDMDDHELEKKDKSENFKAATTEPNPEYKDIEYMTNKLAGGLNGPKGTYPKVADGDNPMQKIAKEEVDLKSQIKADLARRLSEMKK